MKYLALVSCAAVNYSLIAGQVYDLDNEEVINDLLNAKFIRAIGSSDEIHQNDEENVHNDDEVAQTDEANAQEIKAESKPIKTTDEVTYADLENKKVAEIKEICRNLGLKVEGTKDDMIQAILNEYNH